MVLCSIDNIISEWFLDIDRATLNLSNLFLFYYYSSTFLWRALAAFSVSWSNTQPVGLLGRGIRPLQGLYLYAEQHKHRINAHNTDIHTLSWIRTHNPSVRASEDSSCAVTVLRVQLLFVYLCSIDLITRGQICVLVHCKKRTFYKMACG
jgi:hypothetical protein